jgi:hypothetical protein
LVEKTLVTTSSVWVQSSGDFSFQCFYFSWKTNWDFLRKSIVGYKVKLIWFGFVLIYLIDQLSKFAKLKSIWSMLFLLMQHTTGLSHTVSDSIPELQGFPRLTNYPVGTSKEPAKPISWCLSLIWQSGNEPDPLGLLHFK